MKPYRLCLGCIFVLMPAFPAVAGERLSIDESADSPTLGLTIRENVKKAQPKLVAHDLEAQARWFDDDRSAKAEREVELAYRLATNRVIGYRYQALAGAHRGEAVVYRCILSLCAYFGGSVVSGLTVNDEIRYRVEEHSFWQETPIDLLPYLDEKFRLGLTLLDTNLVAAGAGESLRKSQIIPAPEIGLRASLPLTARLRAEIALDYRLLKYKNYRTQYANAGLKASLLLYPAAEIGIGMRHREWVYEGNTQTHARLDVSQTTPFIEFTFLY